MTFNTVSFYDATDEKKGNRQVVLSTVSTQNQFMQHWSVTKKTYIPHTKHVAFHKQQCSLLRSGTAIFSLFIFQS